MKLYLIVDYFNEYVLLEYTALLSGGLSDVAKFQSWWRCSNFYQVCLASILSATFMIMIFYGTNNFIKSVPAFEIGVSLREKLSAAAASTAGIESWHFSASFHVS